jgi:uncharacterized protein (UPF0332 family)
MTTQDSLTTQLQQMFKKARRSLAAARYNIKAGDYDFASSRAYYAAFYAIEALLTTQNLSFSKHASVIAAFNQHFIKPAIFPKEFSKMIERLFRDRQTGDYGFEFSISEDEANEDVRLAERLISSIETYLIQNGFLKKNE